jgi:hypothetical protein
MPPIGYGQLAAAPIIYENNLAMKNRIEKSMEIGDHIDKMIKNNLTKEDVDNYLELLINRKEICKECKEKNQNNELFIQH